MIVNFYFVGIGYNVTISAPHMHAHALELLKDHLKDGTRVTHTNIYFQLSFNLTGLQTSY